MTNYSLEKTKLRFQAYEQIKNKILLLDLRPGEKIFESEIAKDLKVSRTPVREALLMLENERLVENDPRLGFIVKRLASNDVEEYFALRTNLELYGVPLIIKRITESEIGALEDNITATEKSLKKNDLKSVVRYESEFHVILYKSTKSDIYYGVISGLTDMFQLIRAIAVMTSGGADESLDHHKRIVEAIKKKDSKAIKSIIKLHMKSAKETYVQSPLVAFLK
jgi:DNA-binding GntR family transcriptional regulator